MQIQILNKKLLATKYQPRPATSGSGAIDLRASIDETVVINPQTSLMIGTGLKMAIPKGYVGFVAIRSSIGKLLVRLTNGVGIIDSDFTGEVMMNIYNGGVNPFTVDPLDRIGQISILIHMDYSEIEFVESLKPTERGDGGHGSTGRS